MTEEAELAHSPRDARRHEGAPIELEFRVGVVLALALVLALPGATRPRAGAAEVAQPAADPPPAVASAADPASEDRVVRGPLCSPLAHAGIVLGISERRDVVALHGRGTSIEPAFNDSALAYLSSSRVEIMIVEFGADELVAHVIVRRVATSPATMKEAIAGSVSARFDAPPRFGPGGVLRLGARAETLREILGPPQSVETAGQWTYATDYAPTECVAREDVVVRFVDGEVDEIVLAGTD